MIKSASTKLVLCATADHLLAGLWHAGKLQGNQSFNNDESGHAAFAEFLQQHMATPLYLIADAVEEDYRLEKVPHTSGAAKRELISRKLNQFYRGLDYRTAHFVNREQDKRKDDRYLFVALNNADFLQDWIKVIQALNAHLAGVYLLPMLSQVLVKQLKLMSPHILLCEKLSSGLRQTYLHNGRLRMSRLVPNVPMVASQLGLETEKTRLYLISQHFIKRETPLNLVLVSIDGSTQHISQEVGQDQAIECTDINLSEIAKNLSLPANLIEQMPELLHMQLLASGHLADNLAPQHLTKTYEFSQLKRAINIGTLLLALLGLFVAAIIFYQGFRYQSALKEAVQETSLQQHRYDEVAKNFPVTTIGSEDLKVAVELDKTISSYPKSPRRMMQIVSAALEKVPEVQLDRLRWALTNDMNIKDADKFITLATNDLPANSNAALPTDPTKLNELGFITGEITGFTGDYRSALDSTHKLVGELKANPQVAQVEMLQEPVNVSSFVSLQGSTTDEQAIQTQPALFKLKIILKVSEAKLVAGGK